MPIISNAELHYARLTPDRPQTKDYLGVPLENPTWEVQIRTSDPALVSEWKAAGVIAKLIKYKDDYEDPELAGTAILTEGKKVWRITLRKRSLKEDKSAANPVEVIDGNKRPIDPSCIGNGSIANVRVFMREYQVKGEARITPVLMGVQLTKLIRYVPVFNSEDDFKVAETTIVEPTGTETKVADDYDPTANDKEDNENVAPEPKKLVPNKAPKAPVINDDDF